MRAKGGCEAAVTAKHDVGGLSLNNVGNYCIERCFL